MTKDTFTNVPVVQPYEGDDIKIGPVTAGTDGFRATARKPCMEDWVMVLESGE